MPDKKVFGNPSHENQDGALNTYCCILANLVHIGSP